MDENQDTAERVTAERVTAERVTGENASTTIPPVVHMIWYGVDAPSPLHHPNEKYRRGYESIVKNSMCEIKLWTKSDCEYLVAQRYPEYEGVYRAANNIMKYDIMRY